MEEVEFEMAVRACLYDNEMMELFFTEFTLKRMYGKAVINVDDRYDLACIDICLELVNKMPGWLRLHILSSKYYFQPVTERIRNFVESLHTPSNLTYIIVNGSGLETLCDITKKFSSVICACTNTFRSDDHSVVYRPSRLNGRHVVDVLRAVCGPKDITPKQLDTARRIANRFDRDQSAGVEDGVEVKGTFFNGPITHMEW